ncbi:hypothetical protein ACRARG_19245 [Pseudooceanicola sp. C21-150M6]|jgi:hypothetical protein|uniref:hypothetical protein n=1 Tax=Rhodobacterales TaxID=204455 RepID=UPI00025B839B|nr:hypothetical protein [Salipiger marinus]EIE51764.1 hypothetical protein C357_07486 [Citreicella sp. 357]|tara:strand:+ start:201 stop:545 length:345 start_codon:yes stop_codon:yes gene_type:complete
MRRWARLICILSLVAFAIGAVAQSAGSIAMASSMVSTDDGMMAMDDCDACGSLEDGKLGSVCDFVCNAAGMAALLSIPAGTSPIAATAAHEIQLVDVPHGISGPPAQQPPRFYL